MKPKQALDAALDAANSSSSTMQPFHPNKSRHRDISVVVVVVFVVVAIVVQLPTDIKAQLFHTRLDHSKKTAHALITVIDHYHNARVS